MESNSKPSALPGFLRNWIERHQHPVSLWLHALGIPMTVVAIGFLAAQMFAVAAGLFVGGYALQFIGHAIEGNDAGEVILVKKLLGMPYVAVVPRTPPSDSTGKQRSNG